MLISRTKTTDTKPDIVTSTQYIFNICESTTAIQNYNKLAQNGWHI